MFANQIKPDAGENQPSEVTTVATASLFSLGRCLVFDLEVYRDRWCFGLHRPGFDRMIDGDRAALGTLLDQLFKRGVTLVGYNSIRYDVNVVRAILGGLDPYAISGAIINQDRTPDEVFGCPKFLVDHIDLSERLRRGPYPPSLKAIAANLGRPVLRELPYPPDKVLSDDEWSKVIEYNSIDLQDTWAVLKEFGPELQALAVISAERGFDVRSVPTPRVVEKVFLGAYQDKHGKKPPKPPSPSAVRFVARGGVVRPKTPAAAEWFERITTEQIPVRDGKADVPKAQFRIGRLNIQVGAGGLHSIDQPRVYYESDKHQLISVDVASYYPNLIAHLGLSPVAIGDVGAALYRQLISRRLDVKNRAKTETDPAERERLEVQSTAMKLLLNSCFGKLGDQFSPLYDQTSFISVTLSGQLMLIDLIERLRQAGARVLSTNTDGLYLWVRRTNECWRTVLDEWQRDTGTALEIDQLRRLAILSTNQYATLDVEGGVKRKGAQLRGHFDVEHASNGLVIADAIAEALLHDVPPETTILNCHDPARFCSVSKRRGKVLDAVLIDDADGSETPLGKITRYYSAKDSTRRIEHRFAGGRKTTPTGARGIALLDTLGDDRPGDVDIATYIGEARKVVHAVPGHRHRNRKLLGTHPDALRLLDLGLVPCPKYGKAQPPGSSAKAPSLFYDWGGVKTVGIYSGPAVHTLVLDIDKPELFRSAVEKMKPPADHWRDLEGCLVSVRGDAAADEVRAGGARGKLIFRLDANEAIERCSVGKWQKSLGLDLFYGRGIPSVVGQHPSGETYRLDGTLGEVPGWLLEAITPKQRASRPSKATNCPESPAQVLLNLDHEPELDDFCDLMTELETASEGALSRARVGWSPKRHEKRGIIVGTCPYHDDGERDLHAGYNTDGTPYAHCMHTTCEQVNGGLNATLRRRHRERSLNDGANGAPNSGDQTTTASGAQKKDSKRTWKKLRPIRVELRPVPPMVPDLLPGPFQGWLVDCAERACCPLDLFAIGAMVSVASVVGRQLGIRPKSKDDWLVVPNLWGMGVLPPGWLKTHTLDKTVKPLLRLEQEARERHAQMLAEFEVEKLVAVNKAAAAETALKNAAKAKKTDDELKDLAAAVLAKSNLVKPTCRRFIVNDATVEKLGELLAENPFGLLVYRDELMGFLRYLEKEGHENDREFYLEGWNGTGVYTYDRIGRGTIPIDPAVVSVLGGIQPSRLARYIRDTASGDNDDGLLARFQLVTYPDTDQPYRLVDRWPDADAKNRAYAVFQKLATLDITKFEVGGIVEIPYVRFEFDAQEFFNDWLCDLEARLRSSQERACIVTHLAKYRSLLPSLAELFHLINVVDSGKYGPVPLAAARLAARFCEYLEPHARRIYQLAFEGDPEPAQRLAEKIKESLPNPFAVRDVVKKGWSDLKTPDEVQRAVDLLEEHGWVTQVEVKPGPEGGRPSVEIWINPEIRPETPTGNDDATANETTVENEVPTVNEASTANEAPTANLSSADSKSVDDAFWADLVKP
jgi:putative DNA primase/helicase